MVVRIPFQGDTKLNFGCGFDVKPKSEGWVNLDGYVDHPDVVKHDIVKFPYPFPNDFFDLVFAHHVLEHIPVIFHEWNGVQRDVLYGLMEEVHRVLKPGGRFHIVVPLGGTDMGHINPQHYRQWRPEWFRYFKNTGLESSYHKANFRVERLEFNRSGVRARYFMPVGQSRLGITEHLVTRFPRATGWLLQPRHEVECVLVAEKK